MTRRASALLLCAFVSVAVTTFILTFLPQFILGYLGMPRRYHAWPAAAQAPPHPHQVIFVVTSGDVADWREALVLADHYLAGIRPEQAEVEVLGYSGGVLMLAKSAASAEQLAGISNMGVHFVACENAMRTRNLTRADLLPGVTTVPSGVVELVRKQEAGWSYVKVGR